MKILCISDTEAGPELLKKWLAICKKDLESSDKIFHLGDGIKNVKKLFLKHKVIYVKGNHDTYLDCENKEYRFNFRNLSFFLVHGRRKNLFLEKLNIWSNYIRRAFKLPPNLNGYYRQLFKKYGGQYNIVLYGHMHNPRIDVKRNTIFFCPGSFSLKNFTKTATYGIIEVSEKNKKQMTFKIFSIDDKLKKIFLKTHYPNLLPKIT